MLDGLGLGISVACFQDPEMTDEPWDLEARVRVGTREWSDKVKSWAKSVETGVDFCA